LKLEQSFAERRTLTSVRTPTASGHFGAALLLPAGAADDESAGADVADEGEAAGGVSPPPHAATMAPTDAIAARSATIAMFFMIVFLLRGSRATSRTRPLMPQLDLSRQSRDVLL